jgi:hypothetical protein
MASSSRSSRAPARQDRATSADEKEEFCDTLVSDLLKKLNQFKADIKEDIDYLKGKGVDNVDWGAERHAQGIIWNELTQEVGDVQETLDSMQTAGYSSRETAKNRIIRKYEEALKAQKRFLQFCEKHMPPRR